MSLLNEKKNLFAHMFWADAKVWESVFKLSDYERNEKMKELLYHIHTVQHAYLLLWLEQELNIPELNSFRNFRDISEWALNYYTELEKFLDDMSESDMKRIIHVPWAEELTERIGKAVEPSNLSQMMNQVVLHSSYHRGQVNTLIRSAGGEPVTVDYIMWFWLGQPKAEWPGTE